LFPLTQVVVKGNVALY